MAYGTGHPDCDDLFCASNVCIADIWKSPLAMLAVALLLEGCQEPAPPPPEARPVRTITVERRAGGEIVTLTGQIRAEDEVSLAFRLDGRVIERRVNVGDRVRGGQLVARL